MENNEKIDSLIKFVVTEYEKMKGSAHAHRIAYIAHKTIDNIFNLMIEEENMTTKEQEVTYVHEIEQKIIEALLTQPKEKATTEYIDILKQEFENSEIRYGLKD